MALRAIGGALLACALVTPSAGADLVPAGGADAKPDNQAFDVAFQAFVMSDYIYRGVSLSERKPSAGTYIEATWRGLYLSSNWQSVDLPTQPASEITWAGGYRWSLVGFDFDLGASYFWYPGEILADGAPSTSYWEYAFKVERELIKDWLNVKTLVGYSPNVSGTGAWGSYAEAGAEITLPPFHPRIDWELDLGAGYWRFGNTSPMVGGFPLPAYTNWHVGVAFTFYDHLSLDLSYYDTNLSKEDCFVFTGDTMAIAGGVANPVSNPDGLRSRLCGATFVGTLTVQFNLSDLK